MSDVLDPHSARMSISSDNLKERLTSPRQTPICVSDGDGVHPNSGLDLKLSEYELAIVEDWSEIDFEMTEVVSTVPQ